MFSLNGKKNGMSYFLVPLCISVNFVCGQVTTVLRLPLYLDAIGTMAIGALCGPTEALVTALITSFFMSVSNPANLFYVCNYIAIGLTAVAAARLGVFERFGRSFLYGIFIGILCGVLGSVVTMLVYGGYASAPSGIIAGFFVRTFDLILYGANVISECIYDGVDKIIDALIVCSLLKSIPKRMLIMLPYGERYLREWESKYERR